MSKFSLIFQLVLIFAVIFSLAKCSDEKRDNAKSPLLSKLQNIVSRLNEIILRLDPASSTTKKPTKTADNGIEITSKSRPLGKYTTI